MTKAKEGEFVPGYALHEFPFFIWYTYPQLLLKNAAPRPGSFFDRHGGSVLGRRQQSPASIAAQSKPTATARSMPAPIPLSSPMVLSSQQATALPTSVSA